MKKGTPLYDKGFYFCGFGGGGGGGEGEKKFTLGGIVSKGREMGKMEIQKG